jgi:integrase
MRTKLTPTFVAKAAAAPGAERSIFWDESLPCFGLMVTARGHKSFVVQYRAEGVSRRMAFKDGLSLDKAKKEARKIIGEVAKGDDPLQARRKQEAAAENTFRSIAEEYFRRDGAKLRTKNQREKTFERLVYPTLGGRQIGDIKRSDVVRLLDKIEDERGPVMADRTLAALRRVFTWHAGRSDEFRSPIVRSMARTSAKERARARVLSDDELRAVWRAAEGSPGAFGALVRFILLTATRRAEAARMTCGEVTNGDWTIPACRYKTKQDHLIPLSASAQALLADIPRLSRRHDSHVFTTDGKHALGGFSKAKKKLDERILAILREDDRQAEQLPRWTLHDLRRTARSLMSRAGVTADIAERCLGHTIVGVRGVYDRFAYRDEKWQASEALAAQIERIINPQDNVVPLHSPARTG